MAPKSKGLEGRLENLPQPVKELNRYLLWKTEWHPKRKKLIKAPYYASGKKRFGELGTPADKRKLVTLQEALKALKGNDYDGIGLALLQEDGVGAFDIDKCLDAEGELLPNHAGRYVVEQAEMKGAYIEVSPSGKGLRILGPCDDPTAYSRNQLEFWGENRYVTLTGSLWANSHGWKDLSALRSSLPSRDDSTDRKSSVDSDILVTRKTIEELRSALASMDSDERELWIRMGHALKTLPNDKGLDLWLEWSAKSKKFDENDARYTWDTLKPHDITYKSVFAEAQERWEWENPRSNRDDPDDEEDDDEVDSLLDYAIDLGELSLQPTEFVLDGFMACGLNILSGGWGAGKSTNIIPLAASVAHLTPEDWGFHPELRRKVLWVTEAPEQARDTIFSMTQDPGSADWDDWREWFHLVPAVREDPYTLARQIQATIPELTYTLPNGFAVRPFVVLDTVSSNVDMENESDNSEVAKVMARMKERLRSVPLLLIGHSTKAAAQGATNLSFRGASAWEADASATYYLTRDENDIRYMAIGKIRFKPSFTEIAFSPKEGEETVPTEWGEPQVKGYMHGVPRKSSETERANPARDPREAFREDPLPDQNPHEDPDLAGYGLELLKMVEKLWSEGDVLSQARLDRGRPEGLSDGEWNILVEAALKRFDLRQNRRLRRHLIDAIPGFSKLTKTIYTHPDTTEEDLLEL